MTSVPTFVRRLLVAACAGAALSACSPFTLLNAFNPGTDSSRTADIGYGIHPRQKLDVYAPDRTSGPAPVVVFFYGGNWNSGERADYAFIGEALASRGMLAVVADYRLYPEVRYPQFLEDAAQAVAWTAQNIARHGGDAGRIFLMGHSAGAYNAAMLALDPRWLGAGDMSPADLRGWIGLAGPYDFLPIDNLAAQPVFFHPKTPPDSQPIRHVSKHAPPALLIAPRRDSVVNPERNTGGLAKALRAGGSPVTELYFGSVSHPTLIATLSGPLRPLAPTLDAIETFVEANGRKPHGQAIPAIPRNTN